MRIAAVVPCENILSDPDGRTSLYNVFPVFRAANFPARASFTVTVVLLGEEEDYSATKTRVVIADADGNPIGEANGTVPALIPGTYYLQVVRFSDVVFPFPGRYRVESRVGSGEIHVTPFGVFGLEEEK